MPRIFLTLKPNKLGIGNQVNHAAPIDPVGSFVTVPPGQIAHGVDVKAELFGKLTRGARIESLEAISEALPLD